MKNKPLIVGIGGTTRAGSSSEKLVRCVLREIETQGGETKMFGGEALAELPHFTPENSQRSAEQQQFIESIRQADGLVIGSPAYHGGVSGLVKNAIDLLEDLREDTNSYFSGRAVGLVVTAAGWQACGVTLQALRGIVHALRGWPTPLGIAVNSLDQKPFDPDGRLIDPNIKAAIKLQAEQVMVFASK
jgi:FMN reductase